MKRKLRLTLLAVLVAATLAACGESGGSSPTTTGVWDQSRWDQATWN